MPLQHALLALLSGGPSYGYELKASFERAAGPQWGEFNIGHVYQVTDRLARDGLVEGQRVQQIDRPDKTIYELTPRGWDELRRWLGEPFRRQSGYRDDFVLKIIAAACLGEDELRAVSRRQQEHHLGELRALAALRRQNETDALVSLLIEAAIQYNHSGMRMAELAAERAADVVASRRLAQAATGQEIAEQVDERPA